MAHAGAVFFLCFHTNMCDIYYPAACKIQTIHYSVKNPPNSTPTKSNVVFPMLRMQPSVTSQLLHSFTRHLQLGYRVTLQPLSKTLIAPSLRQPLLVKPLIWAKKGSNQKTLWITTTSWWAASTFIYEAMLSDSVFILSRTAFKLFVYWL